MMLTQKISSSKEENSSMNINKKLLPNHVIINDITQFLLSKKGHYTKNKSHSRTRQISFRTDIKNVFIFVFMLFAATAVAKTCNEDSCSVNNCNFEKGIIRFGRTDGSIVSNGLYRTRISHDKITCINQGNWKRPGNSNRGKPYRSPCTKMSDKYLRFSDVWLSDFAITSNNRVSYKWDPNKKWDLPNYKKPKKVFVNGYLKCHESDSSMIIVEDNQGNSMMEIGIPLEFTSTGGDMSKSESEVIIGIALFVLICLMALCICSIGDNSHNSGSDFSTGFLAGMLVNSDWGSSGSSGDWGGYGDD